MNYLLILVIIIVLLLLVGYFLFKRQENFEEKSEELIKVQKFIQDNIIDNDEFNNNYDKNINQIEKFIKNNRNILNNKIEELREAGELDQTALSELRKVLIENMSDSDVEPIMQYVYINSIITHLKDDDIKDQNLLDSLPSIILNRKAITDLKGNYTLFFLEGDKLKVFVNDLDNPKVIIDLQDKNFLAKFQSQVIDALIEEGNLLGDLVLSGNINVESLMNFNESLMNFNKLMTTFFKDLKNIMGSFYIYNTNFKTLNSIFLKSGEHVYNIYLVDNGSLESVLFLANVIQQNNTLNTKLNVYSNLTQVIASNVVTGNIFIQNCPNIKALPIELSVDLQGKQLLDKVKFLQKNEVINENDIVKMNIKFSNYSAFKSNVCDNIDNTDTIIVEQIEDLFPGGAVFKLNENTNSSDLIFDQENGPYRIIRRNDNIELLKLNRETTENIETIS